MAEDQDLTALEASLENASLVDNAIAPASQSAAPSEPADQGTNEAADTKEQPPAPTEVATSDGKDSEPKEQPKESDPTPDQGPQQTQAERQEAARRAYLERQQTRQNVQQQIDETYAPKSEQELIEEGMNTRDAQIEALRQEMQFKEQRTQIAELNAGMQAEAVNALNDFPVFNEKSADYDPDFTAMVQEQYRVAARLQTDDSGLVLNAEVPLYDFYQRMASIYNRGASKGSQQAQADTVNMLGRTEDVGGSSTLAGNKGDSLAELEERLGDMVIT